MVTPGAGGAGRAVVCDGAVGKAEAILGIEDGFENALGVLDVPGTAGALAKLVLTGSAAVADGTEGALGRPAGGGGNGEPPAGVPADEGADGRPASKFELGALAGVDGAGALGGGKLGRAGLAAATFVAGCPTGEAGEVVFP